MAAVGSITINAQVAGLPTGTKTLGPLTINMAAAQGTTLEVALPATTDTTITLPTTNGNTSACVVVPASGNTNALTIKGVAGDTGIPISKVNPFILPFDTSPTVSFVIRNAGVGATTAEILFI